MKRLAFLSVLAAAALAVPALAGKPITVKGSDTMVILGQRWAEKYMNAHAGQVIMVTGGGSGTGIAALINGDTDSPASRPMADGSASSATAISHGGGDPGAKRTIYLHEQPREGAHDRPAPDIYTGVVTNWKQVGGPEAAIVLYGRENSSGTYVYFKDNILLGRDFSPRCQTLPARPRWNA
jgi:phosphate transport system substrate-binding protein